MRTTVKRNLLLIVLSALFVFCGAFILTARTETAKATTDITISNVLYSTKDNEMYAFQLKMSSAPSRSTYDAYSDEFGNSNVPDNIIINGKSVRAWNAEYRTTAASWTFNKFPTNTGGFYYKMPILLRSSGGNSAIEVYIHENMYVAIVAEYGLMDIKVSADILTEDGYTLAADSTLYVVKNRINSSGVNVPNDRDGTMVIPISDAAITKVAKASITVSRWQPSGGLYYFDVYFPGFEAGRAYDAMDKDNYRYIANLIHINGVSARYINENTDVSGYSEFTVGPSSGTGNSTYNKPFMLYVKTAGGRMEIRIKNDWWNANKFGNSMEVSVVPGVYLTTASGIYAAEEEVSYLRDATLKESTYSADAGWIEKSTLTEVGAAGLTLSAVSGDNRPYSPSEQLWFFNIGFAGFTTIGYDQVMNTTIVSDFIRLNGKTVNYLNDNTDTADWSWLRFPLNNSGTPALYHKPVLFYVETSGNMQMWVHDNVYRNLKSSDGEIRITVCKGLTINGKTLTEDVEKIFSEGANVFIDESDITEVLLSEVSVYGWLKPNSNRYFYIEFPGFDNGVGYWTTEKSAYKYIQDIITINGISLKYINENTDVSGYTDWAVFPATLGAAFHEPVLCWISESGKMELRITPEFWADNTEGKGLKLDERFTVGLRPVSCSYIPNGGRYYIMKDSISFTLNDATVLTAEGGWFNEYGKVVGGASVRLVADNSGLRFQAEVDKAHIDALTANPDVASFYYGFKVNREGSAKTVDKVCTAYYEEDGKIKFNAVITGLATTSYTKNFTATPYIGITYADDSTDKLYLGSTTRNITAVATAALNDVSNVADERYRYQVNVNGDVKYSQYSPSQRAILEDFAGTETVEVNGALYSYNKESNGDFMSKSTNSDVNDFFDDYAERYLYRETSSDYITNTAVGGGSMSWKDWEATALSYVDSSKMRGYYDNNNVYHDRNDDKYAFKIANAVVDKYGYVWEGNETGYFGQGWNLPDYKGRRDTSSPFESDGWEFKINNNPSVNTVYTQKNSSILADDKSATGKWGACKNDWAVSSDGSFGTANDFGRNNGSGFFLAHVSSDASYLTFSVNDNNNASGNGVFVASTVKFVEIGLEWHRLSGSFSGIDFIFKNGSGNTYTLDLSTWATTAFGLDDIEGSVHLFVPVFEHANWTGNIKEISIKIKGSFTSYAYLDYVRGCFDVRMADTNAAYINAGRSHFENTGDIAFLTANLPKYRKAMQFLISYMTDANGIINLSELQGHNGGQGYADSLISTYWDILSLAPNSSYVNSLYYKALLDMAYLEEAAAANNISVSSVSVKTTVAGNDIVYTQTASSLRAKAAALKTAVNATLNTGTHTGYFKELSATTGYFTDGYANGNLIDFGSVAFNLIIIDTGLATEEHAEMILNWMLTIPNLYEYVFAPKTNATDVGSQIVWAHESVGYGGSVQNGGAILFVSYYDIMARLKVYGADNAYQRLSEIIAWYNDVKAAYEASGNGKKDFYDAYYAGTGLTLQGNGQTGAVGLDAEFIENAMLLAIVPDGFLGLDTYYESDTAVLAVKPNLPAAVDAWKLEDVRYLGVNFDIYAGNSFVMIKSVEENVSGATAKSAISITLSYSGDTPVVSLNGATVDSGYTVDAVNKTITYTTETFVELTLSVE